MTGLIAEDGGRRLHRERLRDLFAKSDGQVRIASPYVTNTDLLVGRTTRGVRLLTALSRMDVITGASSLKSLRSLIESGVRCRCVVTGPKLHAKVYIFGHSAVVTSANLTWNALDSNIEVGVQVTGVVLNKLVGWFDSLWKEAEPLGLAEIRRWQNDTEDLRLAYAALRKKAAAKSMPRSEAHPVVALSKELRSLFGKSNRFFVCNTDRRRSIALEQRMRERGYAAAWEDFKYPSHMREVEPGNAIFMYAKGVGIKGVGRASGSHEVLEPGNPARIRTGTAREWRVPVDWMAWAEDDADSFSSWSSPNATFFEVSRDKYGPLREGIRRHFSDRL